MSALLIAGMVGGAVQALSAVDFTGARRKELQDAKENQACPDWDKLLRHRSAHHEFENAGSSLCTRVAVRK